MSPMEEAIVRRETELAWLELFLQTTLAGEGQLCLVAGEAGAGKSVLVQEFVAQVLTEQPSLAGAIGRCDAQVGSHNPFLPFRELLAQLLGEAEERRIPFVRGDEVRLERLLRLSTATLIEHGPDLVGSVVPGGTLLAKMGLTAAKKAGLMTRLETIEKRGDAATQLGGSGVTPEEIYAQYTNVLTGIARELPLLLVIEDLHWADAASIDLLLRLARRIGEVPLLLIGTFRPAEVTAGREGETHPLEPVLNEIKRRAGDVLLDLDRARQERGRGFIDTLLDAAPNRLDERFRKQLFRHTGGHPLFVGELLRDMRERGRLVQDAEGVWTAADTLDWEALPARIEGVMQERVRRLTAPLRRALAVGSVEGERFTAEVVAHVTERKPARVIRDLSETLQRRHGLVVAHEVVRIESARLSHYRFHHNLLSDFLYHSLDAVERNLYHEAIGRYLERLYGARSAEIAVSLARHFEQAALPEPARRYLRLSGEQAVAAGAYQGAAGFFRRALALTPPDAPGERFALLGQLERVEEILGQREAQGRRITEMTKLATRLSVTHQAEAALRKSQLAGLMNDYASAQAAAETALGFLAGQEAPALRALAHLRMGRWLQEKSDYDGARHHLAQALETAAGGVAPLVEAHAVLNLGSLVGERGDPVMGRQYTERAIQIYRGLGDRRGTLHATLNLSAAALDEEDYARAFELIQAQVAPAREMGYRYGHAFALSLTARSALQLGRFDVVRETCEQAIALWRSLGARYWEASGMVTLGEWFDRLAEYERAIGLVQGAVEIAMETDAPLLEMRARESLSRIHGHAGQVAQALAQSEAGVTIARAINHPQGEALLMVGAGRLFLQQGHHAAAARAFESVGPESRASWRQEAQGGLALLALEAGDTAQALDRIDGIADQMQGAALTRGSDPLWLSLGVARILHAAGDPRAAPFLKRVQNHLRRIAETIPDDGDHYAFLHRVAHHQAIMSGKLWPDRADAGGGVPPDSVPGGAGWTEADL